MADAFQADERQDGSPAAADRRGTSGAEEAPNHPKELFGGRSAFSRGLRRRSLKKGARGLG